VPGKWGYRKLTFFCYELRLSAFGCAGALRGGELSGAVRKSEIVAVRHSVVPVADGLVG